MCFTFTVICGENHNHVGTFESVLGDQKLVIDPGSEKYTKESFGKNRCRSDMMNSFGHSVPVFIGQLQMGGEDANAIITAHHFTNLKDEISFNLTSAYKSPELVKLNRFFSYMRGFNASFTVRTK